MVGRIIENHADIEEGVTHIVSVDSAFAEVVDVCGMPPLRRKTDGFEELLSAIVSQQLSVAAADTIWGRMRDAGFVAPASLLAANDEDLRACGLSRAKVLYARSLAEANVDFEALRNVPDADVIKELVKIKGIGVWTAEIYAMFSLGRADVFAAGDLALQEAARILYRLDARPTDKALREIAEKWSPWRAVAARLLWAYYREKKQREGVT